VPFTIVLILLISSMVNNTLLNFGKRYKDDLRVIFDQWPKLHLGLDALSNQKILKGVYYSLHRSCYHHSLPYSSMFVIKVGTFFLKVVIGNKLDTIISGSYSSDFAYRLYPSLLVKKLKIRFSPKGLERFF
jgi:hypothetical protein